MPADTDAYVQELADELAAKLAAAFADVIGPLIGGRPLLTPRQVASKLAVSERTVRYMLERREIAYVLVRDGSRRVEQGELDRYIAAHRAGATG
jgi:excisionase family DNA binding protein